MTIPQVTPSTPSNAGLNILLEGPSGTGKTYDIATLVEADPKLEVFVLALETGLESLFGYWRDRGKEIPPNLHWHQITPAQASFLDMLEDAKKVNMLTYEGLTKMVDPNRGKHDSFIKLLTALNDFPDDRTGQKFGAVNTWGTNRALVIDGMTGISSFAMQNVIGGKVVRSQSDWGVAQNLVENLLRKLCDGCRCHFILISHVERETDPVLGGSKITTATLGKALAPKIPAMFSDVILTVREGTKWSWDTSNPLADLKTRNLPFAAGQAPDFKPILEKWKSRGGVV